MKLILLSGGSGKRLWPLSGEIRSKAFLKLLPAPHGGRESMLERVCRQLRGAELLSSTLIVTHQSQLPIMRSQVGESIPILTEPFKRGTLTAIALACAHLQSLPDADPEETLLFMPVDPFVESSFFDRLRELPSVLLASGADLALLGTRPNYPSTQYGYIVPDLTKGGHPYFPVHQFAEKPDLEQANELLKKHALWNCGVFAFSLGFITRSLREYGLTDKMQDLLEIYEGLPEASFDKEIVEHTANTVVVPYEGIWEDLGNWDTFTKHLGTEPTGPGSISPDSRNTHLVSELSQPIHIIGVSDLIVAASEDGILVSSKEGSSRIKEILPTSLDTSSGAQKNSWGSLDILGEARQGSHSKSLIYKLKLHPNAQLLTPPCPSGRQLWIIMAGSGEINFNQRPRLVHSGDTIEVIEDAYYFSLRTQEGIEMIIVPILPFNSNDV